MHRLSLTRTLTFVALIAACTAAHIGLPLLIIGG